MHTHRPAPRDAGFRLPPALAILAAALALAGCGHSKPPTGDAAPQNGAAPTQSADASANGHPDDPMWVPPNGTLHYTIALTGALHQTGPHDGEFRNTAIARKLDVTSRMQATVTSGALNDLHPDRTTEKPAPRKQTVLDDLAKQADACNGNAACVMKISMQLAANPDAHKQIEAAGREMASMLGRTAVWSRRAPCTARITIEDSDDRATWWDDAGEGYYKTGLAKRKHTVSADEKLDCRPNLLSDDPAVAAHLIADGTRIWFDKVSGDYDITFGPSEVEATPSVDGKPGKPRKIGTPEIALTGFSGAAIGKPIHGSKSVDVKGEDGVPLRAEISWTFTPDAS